MKKVTLLVLLYAVLFFNGLIAEAFPKGESPVVGQTYYITGRNGTSQIRILRPSPVTVSASR